VGIHWNQEIFPGSGGGGSKGIGTLFVKEDECSHAAQSGSSFEFPYPPDGLSPIDAEAPLDDRL
jgi:hypothetical protein